MITEAHLLRNSNRPFKFGRERRELNSIRSTTMLHILIVSVNGEHLGGLVVGSSSGVDGGLTGLRRNYSMPSFQKEQYDRMADANNINYGDDYLVDQMNIRGTTDECKKLLKREYRSSRRDYRVSITMGPQTG